MQHSNGFISMPEVPTKHFLKCISLAVGMNAGYVPPNETGAAMYIRPIVYGSSPQLGLNPPQEYTFVVFVLPTGVYHGVEPIDCLILEEFDRTAPRGTGSTKIGGNYAPVLRWSEKARSEGFGITLHLDSKTNTEIDEFSTAGFIGIKQDGDNYIMVVPDSKSIIKSCTSESAQDLARSFGWKVEKRPIPYSELSSFTEVMAAGTAAALVPIKSITLRSKDKKFEYKGMDGKPGPAVVKLLHNLKGIQLGRLEDKFGWRYYVEDPSEWLKSQEANGHGADGVNGSVDGNIDKVV
jgi:branched-chain amino acid aminotransferase